MTRLCAFTAGVCLAVGLISGAEGNIVAALVFIGGAVWNLWASYAVARRGPVP